MSTGLAAKDFKALMPWEQVRVLTGMVQITGDHERDLNHAMARIALICLIARGQAGDCDKSFVDMAIDKAFGVKNSGIIT